MSCPWLRGKRLGWLGLLIGSLWLGACQPTPIASAPTASPAAVTGESLPGQSDREVIRLSGTGGPYTSDPWPVGADTTLRVHWDQASTGEFSFEVAETTATPTDTSDNAVTFEWIVGPSAGASETPFESGIYVVKVVTADGPWQIWIEEIQ